MDTLIGRKLVKVIRLAWHQVGDPSDLNVGPVHLGFDGGRGLFLGHCPSTHLTSAHGPQQNPLANTTGPSTEGSH